MLLSRLAILEKETDGDEEAQALPAVEWLCRIGVFLVLLVLYLISCNLHSIVCCRDSARSVIKVNQNTGYHCQHSDTGTDAKIVKTTIRLCMTCDSASQRERRDTPSNGPAVTNRCYRTDRGWSTCRGEDCWYTGRYSGASHSQFDGYYDNISESHLHQ